MSTGERRQAAILLREHGLRVTPQRRVIWSAFEDGGAGHLSADDVLRRARLELPELARATVYNALNELVSAGLLRLVGGRGSQLYDPNVEIHHHFRCRSCGGLYDVHPTGLENLELEEGGFLVEEFQLMFEGVCANCRE
jgi:Fur family transcriptional regulator, stress-responsive regulator